MLSTMTRTLGWFSCGAASAVACKLTHALPVYCETGSEHPDNQRFLSDCETWLGQPITRLKGDYTDTWEVWTKRRYLAGIDGAPCTVELKIKPRLDFQRPNDIHVFGYTCDEEDRANRLRANYPEMTIFTPLIERGLTKEACLELIQRAGIELPVLYALGFHNNNCIPCVKATSASYWALVRKEFPDKFYRMAMLSMELGVRLCRIDGERRFIHEIPEDHPVTDPVQPSCDFLCQIAEQDIQ